jgi:hypothetical protein
VWGGGRVIVAIVFAVAAAGVALLALGFDATLLTLVAVVPFLGWLSSHFPGVPWTIVPTALLVLLAFQALSLPPAGGRTRPAYGLTAVVMVYLTVAAAQAFSPGLPSVVAGLRGLRIVAEPMILFFAGSEVARRPELRRRLVRVLLVSGAVVLAYGFKQWLGGFDVAERIFFRHTFPVALRERRIFSTLLGATALGNFAAVVAFMAVADMMRQRRLRIGHAVIVVAAAFALFLTGQRGVQLAVVAAGVAVVAVVLLRPGTRHMAARAGQVLTVVFAVLLAVAIITPVQDRRQASAGGQSALDAARIKLALLKQGSQETSFQLRQDRLGQVGHALDVAPLGVGTGLNLLLDPARSSRSTLLGDAGFGSADYQPRLPAIPGELYYYNLASELGLPGLMLFAALSLFGILTAAGVALRHPDREKAAFATAALGILLVIVVDCFTVDAMTTIEVSAYFWLLLGVVGRWAQEDRTASVLRHAPRRVSSVGVLTGLAP